MQIGFIIGKPRSGTTVFKEMLATHASFVNFGEIFNENNGLSFFAFLQARVRDDVGWLLPSRRIDAFVTYIRGCAEKAKTYKPNAMITVLDVKYDQSHFVYNAWRDMDAMPCLFELIKDNGWSVIDIHRIRILDMIVSNEMAIRTGVYHSDLSTLAQKPMQFEMNPGQLEARMVNIRRSYERMNAYFRSYERYLQVIYEEMFDLASGDFRGDLLEIVAQFFGVQNCFDPHPKLRKLLGSDPLSYVSNSDEVRAAIARIATA